MFSFKYVMLDILSILGVVPKTLFMAFLILILGILMGAVLAEIKLAKVPILRHFASILISYIRGIPLIIHLYIAYYALPGLVKAAAGMFGVPYNGSLPAVFMVIMAYSLYTSAVQSENIRASLLSVESGQYEAAYAVGLTRGQAMMRIIFPQALTVAVPVFFNIYLGIIKGLSLAFTVAVVDILAKAKMCSALNFKYLESYVAAGVIYWGLCGLLTFLFQWWEKKYDKGR